MHFNTMDWAAIIAGLTFIGGVFKIGLSIRDNVRDGLSNVERSANGLRKDVDEISGVVRLHDNWLRARGYDRRHDERRSET